MIGIKGIAKKPIIDATANPENVVSGKIFYNNSGKRTGTLQSSDVLTSQIYTFQKGTYDNEWDAYGIYNNVYGKSNLLNGLSCPKNVSGSENKGSYGILGNMKKSVSIDMSRVLYFTFSSSDTKYTFPKSFSTNSSTSVDATGSNVYLIYNGQFAFHSQNGMIVEIYLVSPMNDENYKHIDNVTLTNDVSVKFVFFNW